MGSTWFPVDMYQGRKCTSPRSLKVSFSSSDSFCSPEAGSSEGSCAGAPDEPAAPSSTRHRSPAGGSAAQLDATFLSASPPAPGLSLRDGPESRRLLDLLRRKAEEVQGRLNWEAGRRPGDPALVVQRGRELCSGFLRGSRLRGWARGGPRSARRTL